MAGTKISHFWSKCCAGSSTKTRSWHKTRSLKSKLRQLKLLNQLRELLRRKRRKQSRLRLHSISQQARQRTRVPLHLQSTKMKKTSKKISFRILKTSNCSLTLLGITSAPVVAQPALLQWASTRASTRLTWESLTTSKKSESRHGSELTFLLNY